MSKPSNNGVNEPHQKEVIDPNAVDPQSRSHTGTRGGFQPGAGRPKGSINIYSKDSVKKLQTLGFDPIEKLVAQYDYIGQKIGEMERGERRYSAIAMKDMLALQTNISNTLMKYGYRAVPEKTESVIEEKKPLKIVLTNE